MAAVQFIFSIIIAICAVAMFISAVYIHPNIHFAYQILLELILLCAIQLVNISYKELKSE